MLKLLQNEWMKLWSKRSTWIMTLLLILIVIAGMAITKGVNTVQNTGTEEDWRQNVAADLSYNETQVNNSELSQQERDFYEGVTAIGRYRLEHDVPPFAFTSMQQQVLDSYTMASLVTLFTVIAAAAIVAAEFSQGTIKMLLTRPVKRWKILSSKYITVMLYSILLTVLMFMTTVLASFLLFGLGDGAFLKWTGSEVVESSYWLEALKMLSLAFVEVWIIATFAFMLGTVFRSSSLAIGLSVFLMFTGFQVVFLLARYDIVKYYLFTHIDLTQYYTGFMPVPGITMTFSLVVLTVYFLIFMFISYWTFARRDVTA